MNVRYLASVRNQIRELLRTRTPVVIKESELRVTNMLGDGPGGQAVAKTMNAVRVTHVPTGLSVRSHATRSLELNRRDAIARLRVLLDDSTNGDASASAIERLRQAARKQSASRKSRRKHGDMGARCASDSIDSD